jgi:hypothetical protein
MKNYRIYNFQRTETVQKKQNKVNNDKQELHHVMNDTSLSLDTLFCFFLDSFSSLEIIDSIIFSCRLWTIVLKNKQLYSPENILEYHNINVI